MEHTVCPIAKKCSGCQLSNLRYPEQLAWKESRVRHLIGRYCRVRPILGMDEPYHYRNKVQAAFGTDRGGRIISGVYQSASRRIAATNLCLLEDRTADSIIVTVRRLMPKYRMTAYDMRTGTGFLRHVLVRRGFQSGEVMVVLVGASPVFPMQKPFTAELTRLHPEIATVVFNICDKPLPLTLGARDKVLYGRGHIEETLCGRVFRVSPRSFFQVNPAQTEVLYGTAMELAGLTGTETVLDAYCGVGTIGLVAADRAARVLGVELDRDAVRDAIANAKRNGIRNCWFTAADAGEYMAGMAKAGERPDVVFMDPPRAGSDERFLRSLIRLAPPRVVYISCEPETLRRDLDILTAGGYRAELAQPVDMFPHTNHIEVAVGLTRKRPAAAPR